MEEVDMENRGSEEWHSQSQSATPLRRRKRSPVFGRSSDDIHSFSKNPEEFLTQNTLSGSLLTRTAETVTKSPVLPERGWVKVGRVPGRGDALFVQVVAEQSDDTVNAYLLGYNGENDSPNPTYVDIPKRGAENGTFLFTVDLSGCSVVVTQLDEQTYRVFHDKRVNSSILYDNVVMYVDFNYYRYPRAHGHGRDTGQAVVCMQFADGVWKLFLQRHETANSLPKIWSRGDGKPEIFSDAEPRPHMEDGIKEFLNRRRALQDELKKFADMFGVDPEIVSNAVDGKYEGGQFSRDDDAIRGWNELRASMRQIMAERNTVLLTMKRMLDSFNSPDHPVYKSREKVLNELKEMSAYDNTLEASEIADRTWLWLEIKKAKGTNAVVNSGAAPKQPSLTVGERYAEMEAALWMRSDTAAFEQGYESYQTVRVPGYNEDMTSIAMKKLFVESSLTDEQLGALCKRISIASDQENHLLTQKTQEIESTFKQFSDGSFLESAPQDFFLRRVGDKSGGRCYPLVRVMAVALSRGEDVAQNFMENLRTLSRNPEYSGESASSQATNAGLFRDALAGLHANVEAIAASEKLPAVFGLPDVATMLSQASESKVYALNTETHSMLAAVIVDKQSLARKYYFYDPNFLMAGFSDITRFSEALKYHFVDLQFAGNYKAFGTAEAPQFNLVLIDTTAMADAHVDGGITVKQLSEGVDLTDVFDSTKKARVVTEAAARLAEDQQLRTGLTIIEADQWANRWQDAVIRLKLKEGLSGEWMPLLEKMQENADGSYQIDFINTKNSGEIRGVSTRDATFKEFKSYLDKNLDALRKDFIFQDGVFKPLEGEAIDGLNAMFAVQMIIDWFNRGTNAEEDAASGSTNAQLSLAIKVHSYINMAQVAHTAVTDVAKVHSLVKSALYGEQVAGGASLLTFGKALKFAATEGLGVLLGASFVILDAYQLSLVENDVQKAIIGTQLAFDSASFLAGIGAIVAGASGVGMILGGASVILGGLGIGFGALAQAFGQITADAQLVGEYFALLDEAYSGGGYRYESKDKALMPLAGAVIDKIRLADKHLQVHFDSQFIYRTHHGSTGSGKINYFFWVGDKPKMVHDRSQAINVREQIGYKNDSATLELPEDASDLILPATPKSFITYRYEILPFATSRHDRGFDVIRRLEEDYRFDYDFYIFPSEYTIRTIIHEYVETKVAVVLDRRSLRLGAPELRKEQHGYLIYEIEGTGGQYVICLNQGSTVTLKTTGSEANKTLWILDARQLIAGNDSITVSQDSITIGGTTVHLRNQDFDCLQIVMSREELLQVDLASREARVFSEDASKWLDTKETIHEHLHKLAEEHRLLGQFVVVNNYSVQEQSDIGTLYRGVGRAYYDAAHDRLLYTDVEDETLTRDAALAGVTGEDAYFYNVKQNALWRVNAGTHQVITKYYPTVLEDPDSKMARVEQHGNIVVMAMSRLNHPDKGVNGIIYLVHQESMVLTAVIGNSEMLKRLRQTSTISLTELRGVNDMALVSTMDKLPGQKVVATNAEFVTILAKDEQGSQVCFWLRTVDGVLIKPSIQPPIPTDLTLTVSSHKVAGQDVFYFYSIKEQTVYRQQGTGQTNDTSVGSIPIPGLSNLFTVYGEVFATTNDGRILRLLEDGSTYLEGISEHWLIKHPKWWQDLATLEAEKATTIAVFGVRDPQNAVVPIWYHNGKIAVASSKLYGKQLQFLGFNSNGEAWLFDLDGGILYSQPLVDSQAVDAIFSLDGKLVAPNLIPQVQQMLNGQHLRNPVIVDGRLHVTTIDGVVVGFDKKSPTLVAVNKAWQISRQNRLEEALGNLLSNWSDHNDAIVLQGDPESAPAWYYVPSREIVTANGLTWADHPLWLGMAVGAATPYIYSTSRRRVYAVDSKNMAKDKGEFAAAHCFAKSLVLQSIVPEEITIPTLAGTDFALVAATNATIVIDRDNWKHYKAIVLDNKVDQDGGAKVVVGSEIPMKVLVRKFQGNLEFFDPNNGNVVILQNVLKGDGACSQIEIKVGDAETMLVSDFSEIFSKTHPLVASQVFELGDVIAVTKHKSDYADLWAILRMT